MVFDITTLGPLVERDHDHGNVWEPGNTSKGHPMEIQKLFMYGPKLSTAV